jgi:hypothetical protein
VDPNNGTDFATMGTSQLLSVPYALYAKSGGGDADADPVNEIQTLSKSGTSISLSKGGGSITDAVDDADANPSNEIQTLSKSGTSISLSNGGGSITDAVDDADADPTNELQNISLAGNTLSLSRSGGSVILPTGGSSWTDNGSDYTYSNRNIGINTSTPSTDFEIYHSEGTAQMSHNSIAFTSATGDNRILLGTVGPSPGWIGTYGPNNSVNTVSGFVSGYLNNGSISVLDENSNFVANI